MQRYTEFPFPPYTYVPGKSLHPIGDPRGHGCPGPEIACAAARETDDGPDTTRGWETLDVYWWAIDLFNHGYYWESHEAWESIWHSFGREGSVADFLKGLIKLAAAGVKAHEGNLAGVQRHAKRAEELFGQINAKRFGRLDVLNLRSASAQLKQLRDLPEPSDPAAPVPVLGVRLVQLESRR